jgi:hypothetical protein
MHIDFEPDTPEEMRLVAKFLSDLADIRAEQDADAQETFERLMARLHGPRAQVVSMRGDE